MLYYCGVLLVIVAQVSDRYCTGGVRCCKLNGCFKLEFIDRRQKLTNAGDWVCAMYDTGEKLITLWRFKLDGGLPWLIGDWNIAHWIRCTWDQLSLRPCNFQEASMSCFEDSKTRGHQLFKINLFAQHKRPLWGQIEWHSVWCFRLLWVYSIFGISKLI